MITQLTSQADIEKMVLSSFQGVVQAILQMLDTLGQRCVKEATAAGRYINRTGALRSSIGYVVCDDSRIYSLGGFKKILNGDNGAEKGRLFALKLARENKGLTLYIVAGTNYAAYVAAKGFDVLDSSQLFAERNTPILLRSLGFAS